jgi:hypothetical protein
MYAPRQKTLWDRLLQDDPLKLEDPNPDPVLCADCADVYNAEWDEMFAEARSGLL